MHEIPLSSPRSTATSPSTVRVRVSSTARDPEADEWLGRRTSGSSFSSSEEDGDDEAAWHAAAVGGSSASQALVAVEYTSPVCEVASVAWVPKSAGSQVGR